jgi:nucleotide-binding universal stress UspA family protein
MAHMALAQTMTESIEPGTLVDGFRLEEKIHQGSMAEIWRVSHSDQTSALAMKIPSWRDSADPAALVGFEVERMILPRLSGPHAPRFVASGDGPPQPYLVMERVAGESLRARLDETPLPLAEVASIGARVAAALHDLHGQRVIHLDVKPSNVMFRETGEAVLVDFGLSRHEEIPDLLAEQFRLPMGTGPYISPEQIRGIRSDPRSDQFGLGVLLYFLTTGQRPFGNPTSVGGLKRRLYRDPTPPRAIRSECPPWLQEVILRCLEVAPENRFDTAAQLSFALQHPDEVRLGERARRTTRDGVVAVARRRLRLIGEPGPGERAAVSPGGAPIVVIAIDLAQGSQALSEALRHTAGRVLATEPRTRLACLTVLKTARIALETGAGAAGRNLRIRTLGKLKRWTRPLGTGPGKVTHHVLEAPDPAAAILEFARANRVEQVIIGSRGSSTLRRYLGSVSSQVVAQAECTVTVVKAPLRDAEPAGVSPG